MLECLCREEEDKESLRDGFVLSILKGLFDKIDQPSQHPDESAFHSCMLTAMANDRGVNPRTRADRPLLGRCCHRDFPPRGFFPSLMRTTEVLSRGWADYKARSDD